MNAFEVAAIAVIVAATLYAVVRKAPVSLAFALACLAVYAIEEVAVRVAFAGLGLPGFGGFAPPFLGTPELVLLVTPEYVSPPWTWVTFQFLHAGVDHLLFNLMGFVFLAPILEERIGSPRWAILFLAGGAFGAGVFLLVNGMQGALVGASAGLLAVFGAFGRLYPRERVRLFLPLPGVPAVPVITLVIVFLLLEIVLGLDPRRGVAWQAHVGGIVFGFAFAPALLRLPFGRVRGTRAARRLTRLEGLQTLATTPELRAILGEAERADIPEIRDAWVEKFIASARCPRCAGPLRRSLGRITSECGWKGGEG